MRQKINNTPQTLNAKPATARVVGGTVSAAGLGKPRPEQPLHP